VLQALNKQHAKRYLIIYLIMSLLFVVSVKLHVHLGEDAFHSSHGETVAVSIAGSDMAGLQHEHLDEVQVGLDKFTSKILKNIVSALIFITAFLVLQLACIYCIRRLTRSDVPVFSLPFAGTPPLRAPPR